LIELDGQDMRHNPLETRKASLERLLSRAAPGIAFNQHITGDGTIIFKHACKLGFEGIISKRKLALYLGAAGHWIKSKNPEAPAVRREAEEDWGR
jgi:bifunctional non-homologous end joining protein LigD